MFRNILQQLRNLGESSTPFDASRFGDPVALKTQWSPAKSGGTNFRTHKLVEVDITRVEFRASMGAKIFCSVFMVSGLGFIVVFSAIQFSNETFSFDIEMMMPILFGLLFFTVGALMLYFAAAPAVFDKASGYFWKGRKAPQDVSDPRALKNVVQIGQIHALQLLAEYVRGSKSSYYSYELNLVLEDGKRLNVVDHGNQTKLREDAKTLSQFLGKPVWDAI